MAAIILLAAACGPEGSDAPVVDPAAQAAPSERAGFPPAPPPEAVQNSGWRELRRGRPDGLGQVPAFPEQTRAPQPASPSAFRVGVYASGLSAPWGMEFLPDGRLLVTERAGRLRIVTRDGRTLPPVGGLPPVYFQGQGGLLDVALSPDFAASGRIFWSFAEPRGGDAAATAVGTGVISGSENVTLADARTIFRQEPAVVSGVHFGSRLVFDADGRLFVTTGDRGQGQPAQSLSNGIGKVLRINPDGSIPAGNPGAKFGGPAAAIWSYGHRNLQGAALEPQTGRLWTVEHGPQGGDELNLPLPMRNHGWPVITYGVSYGGAPIGNGETARLGMRQPVYFWDPVIAPGGMDFYTGSLFPAWRGNLLIGGLQARGVVRLVIEGDLVRYEERLPLGARARDVKTGPDGAVYVATDDGRILRITPA